MSRYSSTYQQTQRGNRTRNQRNNFGNTNNRTSVNIQIRWLDLIGNTQYLPHTNSDVIYLQTLSRVTNNQAKQYLQQQLMDLNILLYFKSADFWKQLNQSSLRKALQGALSSFSNRQYGLYVDKQNQNELIDYKSKIAGIQMHQYQLLTETIFKIYYRIIFEAAENQQLVVQIYDQWLLDIPKILDLIAVYKHSNPTIVTQMVTEVFKMNPDYSNDFTAFLSIIITDVIPLIFKDLRFEINMFKLNTSNFANPHRSFLRNMMKCVFFVHDYFIVLRNIIDFFPRKQVSNLIADYEIVRQSIIIHTQFTNNFRKKWVLQQKFSKILKPMFQKVWQFQIEYFGKLLKILNYSLKNGQLDYFNDKLESYFIIVTFINQKVSPLLKSQNGQDYVIFMKTIQAVIKQSKQSSLFFHRQQLQKLIKKLNKTPLSKKELILLDQSFAFEQRIRAKKRDCCDQYFQLSEQNPIINKIMPYQQWLRHQVDFQNEIMQPRQNKGDNVCRKLHRYYVDYDDQPEAEQQQFIFKTISLPNQFEPACLADRPRYVPKHKDLNVSVRQSTESSRLQPEQYQNLSFSIISQNFLEKLGIEQQVNRQFRDLINQKNNRFTEFQGQISNIQQLRISFQSDTLYECSLDDINILKDLNFQGINDHSFVQTLQALQNQQIHQQLGYFHQINVEQNVNLSFSMVQQNKKSQLLAEKCNFQKKQSKIVGNYEQIKVSMQKKQNYYVQKNNSRRNNEKQLIKQSNIKNQSNRKKVSRYTQLDKQQTNYNNINGSKAKKYYVEKQQFEKINNKKQLAVMKGSKYATTQKSNKYADLRLQQEQQDEQLKDLSLM